MSGRFIDFCRVPCGFFAWIIMCMLTHPAESQTPIPVDTLVDIVENARASTVRIEAQMPLEDRMGVFGQALKKRLENTDASARRWYVSMGSGIVWDHAGHIVTTASIVHNAHQITVHTSKGQSFEAIVIGIDDLTNLAVLKAAATSTAQTLLPIPYRAGKLPEGSALLLLGYGIGGIPTISSGIAGVPPEDWDTGRHWFQFTAPLRPGNSGGALIDSRGQLAGIVLGREEDMGYNAVVRMLTSATKPEANSQVTAYSNFGVGVPINQATLVVNQIIDEGHVVRGWIGVSVQKMADRFTGDTFLQVVHVVPDSPADHAGLQLGDHIRCINLTEVRDPLHLGKIVHELPPGTRMPVDFDRQKQSLRTEIVIGERPVDNATTLTSDTADPVSFPAIQVLNAHSESN
ncbi:trypsin-like peptidase domain-containing protein [bacterium]|nr:trypsin-like peptidase domain-containing protein [candidate division CSSED10-310 bacterium]